MLSKRLSLRFTRKGQTVRLIENIWYVPSLKKSL